MEGIHLEEFLELGRNQVRDILAYLDVDEIIYLTEARPDILDISTEAIYSDSVMLMKRGYFKDMDEILEWKSLEKAREIEVDIDNMCEFFDIMTYDEWKQFLPERADSLSDVELIDQMKVDADLMRPKEMREIYQPDKWSPKTLQEFRKKLKRKWTYYSMYIKVILEAHIPLAIITEGISAGDVITVKGQYRGDALLDFTEEYFYIYNGEQAIPYTESSAFSDHDVREYFMPIPIGKSGKRSNVVPGKFLPFTHIDPKIWKEIYVLDYEMQKIELLNEGPSSAFYKRILDYLDDRLVSTFTWDRQIYNVSFRRPDKKWRNKEKMRKAYIKLFQEDGNMILHIERGDDYTITCNGSKQNRLCDLTDEP